MPKLRSQWYDLYRDMNWRFKYVTEAEVFPEALSQSHGIPAAAWWNWDEDASAYSVRSAIARSRLFENLDPGWKAAVIAHYGAIAMPEYLAFIGEARMGGRFSPQAGTPGSLTQCRTLGVATERPRGHRQSQGE